VSEVNTETSANLAGVAERAVKDILVWAVIVEIAKFAVVLSERSAGITSRVDAAVICWLQRAAPHAIDFCHRVAVEW
jgi:hypothetical protein